MKSLTLSHELISAWPLAVNEHVIFAELGLRVGTQLSGKQSWVLVIVLSSSIIDGFSISNIYDDLYLVIDVMRALYVLLSRYV
jgi:hypothetical protein